MKYFVYQGNDGDCGFASLKMLLAKVHHNKGFLNLKKPINKRKDYSFKDIVDIAKDNGVTLKAYKYERKFDVVDKDSTMFMAILSTTNGGNHLVLINKFNDNRLEVYDPSNGIYVLEFQDFLDSWTGLTLELVNVEKVKNHLPKVRITNNILKICSYVVSTLAAVSIFLGMYFLQDSSKIIVPILLLASFALFDLAEKLITIKSIENFDKKYTYALARVDGSTFKESYIKYNEFKKMYFSYERKFVFSLAMASFITVILCFNSPAHALPLIGLLIVNIIDRFVLQKNNDRRKKTIELLEAETYLCNDSHGKELLLAQINKNTYSYVFNISARKCIYNFLCIMASLCMMSIQGVVSVNFVIFEFFAFNLFSDNLDATLGFSSQKDEYEKLKSQFIDTFVY